MSAIEYINGATILSSTGSIVFSSIPSTYKDLIIQGTVTAVSANVGLRVRFNTDGGANYSQVWMIGNGTSASSNRENAQSSTYGAVNIGATSNPILFNIFSYADTSVHKTLIGYDMAPDYSVGIVLGKWASTAAINTVSIALGGAFPTTNMSAATVTLWGVK